MKGLKPPKPSKEMQKALDRVPEIVKRDIKAGKHHKKIQKRFQEALGHIFKKPSKK